MKKITIYDLFTELYSYVTIEREYLDKARSSDIDVNNNAQFREYAIDWMNGAYDNDPDLLVEHLIALL